MNEKPKRLSPTLDSLKQLLLKSGNLCAYPDCDALMMTEDGLFIGQICHIEAAEPGGERFNTDMTNEERRAESNLMLMCYSHHVETNDIARFPVTRLRRMKSAHEHRFAGSDRAIRERVARLKWQALVAGGLVAGTSLSGLIKQLRELLGAPMRPANKPDGEASSLRQELLQVLRYAPRGTVHCYSRDPLHMAVAEVFIEVLQESGWYIDRLSEPLSFNDIQNIDFDNSELLLFTVRDAHQFTIAKASINEFFDVAGFKRVDKDDVTTDVADGRPIRFYTPVGVKPPR